MRLCCETRWEVMWEVGRARVGILDGNPPVNHGYRIAGVCRTVGWAERADRSWMQISSCCRRLCQAARTCRRAEPVLCTPMAPDIGFSSRRRRGRSATAAGSVTRTMTMSVERDKTGLRRCKQRGRSHSCCLLRKGEKRKRQSRRHRVVPSGRGYDRVSGAEPARQALAGGVLITRGERVAFGRVNATRGH